MKFEKQGGKIDPSLISIYHSFSHISPDKDNNDGESQFGTVKIFTKSQSKFFREEFVHLSIIGFWNWIISWVFYFFNETPLSINTAPRTLEVSKNKEIVYVNRKYFNAFSCCKIKPLAHKYQTNKQSIKAKYTEFLKEWTKFPSQYLELKYETEKILSERNQKYKKSRQMIQERLDQVKEFYGTLPADLNINSAKIEEAKKRRDEMTMLTRKRKIFSLHKWEFKKQINYEKAEQDRTYKLLQDRFKIFYLTTLIYYSSKNLSKQVKQKKYEV